VRAAPAVVLPFDRSGAPLESPTDQFGRPAAGGARAEVRHGGRDVRPAIDARSGLRPGRDSAGDAGDGSSAGQAVSAHTAARSSIALRVHQPSDPQRGAATVAAPVSGGAPLGVAAPDGSRRFAGSVLLPALPDRADHDIQPTPGRIASRRRPIRCLSTALPDAYVTSTASRAGGTRLTARGRQLRAVVCVAALVIASWITVTAVLSALRTPVIPPSAPAVVQVHSGDTLWSIATALAPDRDTRAVVSALQARNHLSSTTVHPGQRLQVPR